MPNIPTPPVEEIEVEEVEEEEHECDCCGSVYGTEAEANSCCYECGHCGARHEFLSDAEECCQYRCPDCDSLHDYAEDAQSCCRGNGRDYPTLASLDNPYLLTVPVIEGRPARICSIEQEINAGGSEATQMLYDFGFADRPEQGGYSSGGSPGRVIVKSDASLSGDDPAEIVYSRFLLSEQNQVRDLSSALGRMRQLAREVDVVRVNKTAGTHIHISARAENGSFVGPSEMASLHEIFCYAEDFLYSMAAAGWDAHRASPDGAGYCKPVPKLPSGEKATGWRVHGLMSRDRYFGLNFQRLIGAASNCGCGAARFGEWKACECGSFDAATVEWRLFNASTKPETLHAWLLLAHSLTAMSADHVVGTLPANPYSASSSEEDRRSVQSWIERNAPLTDDEVYVIRAAARKAPGLGKPRRVARR